MKKAFEADFIFGQFGQLECVAGSLLNLQSIAMERKEFDGKRAMHFGLLMQTLGIAGGPYFGGHMVTSVWDGFFENIEVVGRLADGKSPVEVYNDFIDLKNETFKMGEMLALEENEATVQKLYGAMGSATFANYGMFVAALEKALVRMALMLRFDKEEELSPLIEAVFGLSFVELSALVKELNRSGIDDGWAILLMYSPTLLQSLNKDKDSRLSCAERIQIGLKCLHVLYKEARKSLELKLFVGSTGEAGARARSRSGGSSVAGESDSDAEGDEDGGGSENVEGIRGGRVAENGVYEVDCYQVATWAKNSIELRGIIATKKKSIHLEHSFLDDRLGEALFRIDRVATDL